MQELLLSNSSSLQLKKVKIPGTDITLVCDDSTGKFRPYVPNNCRRMIFDKFHKLSHPGARATTRLVCERYVWPSIKKDCRTWSRVCEPCQRSKVSRHNSAPLGKFETPTGRFLHVHMDIIGPLSVSDEYRYCLTAIDRVTRWPEVWPMRSTTAEEVASTFTREWISRFGVPSVITTDRGTQFESDLFRRLMHIFATKRIRTTAYHPAANGMIERVHRQLKAALMCHGESWTKALPFVLLGMRSAFKEDIKATAAELVYGETLRLPGEIVVVPEPDCYENAADLVSQLRQHMSNIRPVPASRHSQPKTFLFKDMDESSHVLLRDDAVRRPLQPPYTGPYKVIERASDKKTVVIDYKGKPVVVTMDRVKPVYLEHSPSDTHPEKCFSRKEIDRPAAQPLPICPPSKGEDEYKTRSGRRVRFKTPLDL